LLAAFHFRFSQLCGINLQQIAARIRHQTAISGHARSQPELFQSRTISAAPGCNHQTPATIAVAALTSTWPIFMGIITKQQTEPERWQSGEAKPRSIHSANMP
jgi:hypothetical protein